MIGKKREFVLTGAENEIGRVELCVPTTNSALSSRFPDFLSSPLPLLPIFFQQPISTPRELTGCGRAVKLEQNMASLFEFIVIANIQLDILLQRSLVCWDCWKKLSNILPVCRTPIGHFSFFDNGHDQREGEFASLSRSL
jgi:hypothetical protein